MTRYVALAAAHRTAVVAAALLGLFSLLELVEQLGSVGIGRYHIADALLFVLLTAPARLLAVAPASLLLGTLLSLGAMARARELAAMAALGVSEWRIVGAVLLLVPPLALLLLANMQFAVPPAEQFASEWRASALAGGAPVAGYWTRHGRDYLNVERFERGDVPVGVAVYGFGPDGTLRDVLEARRATIGADDTWLLRDVTRRRISDWRVVTDHLPTLAWHSFISPAAIRFLVVPIGSVAPLALLQHLRALPPDQRGGRLRLLLWQAASLPLALAAMVLAAAPFVFGPPRENRDAGQLARGVGVGIAFALGQQIASRLGLLLDVPPAAIALAPPLLVIALALAVWRRRHGSRPAAAQAGAAPLSLPDGARTA